MKPHTEKEFSAQLFVKLGEVFLLRKKTSLSPWNDSSNGGKGQKKLLGSYNNDIQHKTAFYNMICFHYTK